MAQPKQRKASEVCRELGLERAAFVYTVERQWILPREAVTDPFEAELDEEDIARLRLIFELRDELGVNDAAVPIILHLIDQLNALRRLTGP